MYKQYCWGEGLSSVATPSGVPMILKENIKRFKRKTMLASSEEIGEKIKY